MTPTFRREFRRLSKAPTRILNYPAFQSSYNLMCMSVMSKKILCNKQLLGEKDIVFHAGMPLAFSLSSLSLYLSFNMAWKYIFSFLLYSFVFYYISI